MPLVLTFQPETEHPNENETSVGVKMKMLARKEKTLPECTLMWGGSNIWDRLKCDGCQSECLLWHLGLPKPQWVNYLQPLWLAVHFQLSKYQLLQKQKQKRKT